MKEQGTKGFLTRSSKPHDILKTQAFPERNDLTHVVEWNKKINHGETCSRCRENKRGRSGFAANPPPSFVSMTFHSFPKKKQ